MTNETDAPQPSQGAPLRPPPGRYGPEPTPRRRRLVVAGIVLVALVGVAITLAIGLRSANEPVRYKDFGFDVVGPERVDVTFDVYMDAGTTAVCTLDALNESYAQVGTVDVTVGPVDVTEARYTVEVATSELATTGIVQSCRVVP
jgi:hypothetical protein